VERQNGIFANKGISGENILLRVNHMQASEKEGIQKSLFRTPFFSYWKAKILIFNN